MKIIAIDGASRRNGKPDCVSAGGVFIMDIDEETLKVSATAQLSEFESASTNQRGEMLALLAALRLINEEPEEAQVITDSEYLFNTMTKSWLHSWQRKGWVTASGSPVKNRDLWEKILSEHNKLVGSGAEVMFYHIKGHLLSVGKVTARQSLREDPTGRKLLEYCTMKYTGTPRCPEADAPVQELSVKNNGFELNSELLQRFVVVNTMADAIATRCVEAADVVLSPAPSQLC